LHAVWECRHRLIDLEPRPPQTLIALPIRAAANEYCQFGEEVEAFSAVVPIVVGPKPNENTRCFCIGPGNVAHLAIALWDIRLVDTNGVHP